jgi:hypothetical protein
LPGETKLLGMTASVATPVDALWRSVVPVWESPASVWKALPLEWKTPARAWKTMRIRWKNGAPVAEYLWKRLSKSGAVRWKPCGNPVKALWIEGVRCPGE